MSNRQKDSVERRHRRKSKRQQMLDEITTLDQQLESQRNSIMLKEMEKLVRDFRERVKNNSQYDTRETRLKWRVQADHWAVKYQQHKDRNTAIERAPSMLPREEAVLFRGDNASAFWSHYSSSVFSNTDLTARQKMSHFLSRVKEHHEASFMAAGFSTDGSQLEACIQTFKDRYLDPKILKAEAWKRAHCVKPLTSFKDTLKATEFVSSLRNIISLLRDTVHEDDRAYTEVVRELITKLPSECTREFYRRHYANNKNGQKVTLGDSLMTYVEDTEGASGWERYVQGDAYSNKEHRREKREHSRYEDRSKRRRNDTAGAFTIVQGECLFCQSKEHATSECTELDISQRMSRLKKSGLCYRCANHEFQRDKPCPGTTCSRCSRNHARAVCGSKSFPFKGTATCTAVSTQSKQRTYIFALQAKAMIGDRSVRVRVLLDNCAETSLITSRVVSVLNGTTETVPPLWLAGVTDGHRRTDQLAKLTIMSMDGRFAMAVKAFVTPTITTARISAPSQRAREMACTKGVSMEAVPMEDGFVDILIGQDELVPLMLPEIEILGTHLCATRTRLGWTIVGCEKEDANRDIAQACVTVNEGPSKATHQSCQLCQDLNSILDVMVLEDDAALEEQGVAQLDITHDPITCRYTVRLPKRALVTVNDNYSSAAHRLAKLKRKLLANEQYDEYDAAIQAYVQQGYAEPVSDPSRRSGSHVIPHRAVFKKDATKSKCRIVFDARALNRSLCKGESINADIWAVLIRFRLAPIALMTDLKKAFSQIQIHPDDRDLLRYLWYSSKEDDTPAMFRMSSVTFGLTSSPFILGAVLRHHVKIFGLEFPRVAAQMDNAAYMDDCVFTAENVEEARAIVGEAEPFFAKASFELHPWVTNQPMALAKEPDMTESMETLGGDSSVNTLLGILWNTFRDVLQIKPIPVEELEQTKRGIVSVLSKFYDPLSWFAPMKTRCRNFLRELARDDLGWNDVAPPEMVTRAEQIAQEMLQISTHTIPRTIEIQGERALHVFCDASFQAYGAVAYVTGPDGESRMLIGARVKLAPKKFHVTDPLKKVPETTIPRLELMAAVEGARLVERLLRYLPQGTPFALYSDSTVTLYRLKGDPNSQQPFEMRRLLMILELSTPEQWHHVPTAANPADLLTRDIDVNHWLQGDLWWNGPNETEYSLAQPTPRQQGVCLAILQDADRDILNAGLHEALKQLNESISDTELDEANNGKERPQDRLEYARTLLWRLVQKAIFPEEVSRLKHGQAIQSRSRLRMLRPFLDEWGLLRNKRLVQSPGQDWQSNHPLLLGPHQVVVELIQEEHGRRAHSGERDLREHMNDYYCLLGGRRLIKGVVRRCERCNIQRGQPFCPPEPALPAFRSELTTVAFRKVGVDYFGPLKTRGNRKFYGLLITCAVTRAVHLELVTSISAKHGLNALQRAFARRGVPTEVHSDNAQTFVALKAALELITGSTDRLTPGEENIRSIKWIFQVPRAPWWGGFFERLVQVVKHRLQHTEINRTANQEEIRTILCTVEAIVNSRPLVDAEEHGLTALTPAHFIVGRSLLTLPPLPALTDTGARESLLDTYDKQVSMRQELARRLQLDYVKALQNHRPMGRITRAPRLHERVLVTGEEKQFKDRFEWPIGRIEEFLPTTDGVVRAAWISMKGRSYKRAVKNLVPLEGHLDPDPTCSPGGCGDSGTTGDAGAAGVDGAD